MMTLIEYIIAIMLVILFLVGATLLSLRLRIRGDIGQRSEEKVQLDVTDDQPNRRFFRPIKSEHMRVL
jgi:hypothetical protein